MNIFAYCIMPNHFHFVLRPSESIYLSKWMHWLLTTHARCYHQHYNTSGHIWQGRFKSFIIQNDDHLLTVLRYVEGNPVRSGLILSSRDWLWSSHKYRIKEKISKIIDPLPIRLPQDWTEFVDKTMEPKKLKKLRESVNHQIPFGKIEWMKEIAQSLGLKHVVVLRGRPRKNQEND